MLGWEVGNVKIQDLKWSECTLLNVYSILVDFSETRRIVKHPQSKPFKLLLSKRMATMNIYLHQSLRFTAVDSGRWISRFIQSGLSPTVVWQSLLTKGSVEFSHVRFHCSLKIKALPSSIWIQRNNEGKPSVLLHENPHFPWLSHHFLPNLSMVSSPSWRLTNGTLTVVSLNSYGHGTKQLLQL